MMATAFISALIFHYLSSCCSFPSSTAATTCLCLFSFRHIIVFSILYSNHSPGVSLYFSIHHIQFFLSSLIFPTAHCINQHPSIFCINYISGGALNFQASRVGCINFKTLQAHRAAMPQSPSRLCIKEPYVQRHPAVRSSVKGHVRPDTSVLKCFLQQRAEAQHAAILVQI